MNPALLVWAAHTASRRRQEADDPSALLLTVALLVAAAAIGIPLGLLIGWWLS